MTAIDISPTLRSSKRQIARDRQRALRWLSSTRICVDVDAIGLEIDLAVEIGIGHAVRLERERGVLNGNGAVGDAGSAAVPVTWTCASSVPVTFVNAVVKPWTSPTSIGVLSTRQIDRFARGRIRCSLKSAVGTLPLGLEPRRRILLQLRVERHRLAGVVDGAAERVVPELPEAALLDGELRVRLRAHRSCR